MAILNTLFNMNKLLNLLQLISNLAVGNGILISKHDNSYKSITGEQSENQDSQNES